ncbi:hypothetical protein KFK09_014951 [Dendrobium nobile]|uniref:Uncharacterized protein n=1 Tax=Dendrobium nobile TaxID=94219 RepID=A0A8T3B3H2_DENNO|nr:hypothetical protein KFK09_014951 [Dendrobium nobile]
MKVEQILHMIGGVGGNSYANNSKLQEKAILKTKPMVEEAISDICNTIHTNNIVVADLGCSSGPNTLLVLSHISNAIEKHYCQYNRKQPEIQYFFNDLPSNDFNSIFQLLMLYEEQLRENKAADYVNLYAVGLPGSFYGRLFPTKTVHFFHSSYSLMWLTQVPQGLDEKNCAQLNKGNIYIADASSSIVYHLYLNQFKKDFSKFLRSRSKELIFGGKMVLSFLGRKNSPAFGDIFNFWSLLADALNSMISEGLVEEAKVNTFNLPFYAPLMEEVKSIIEMEGSFHVGQTQTFESNWDPFDDSTDNFVINSTLSGQNVAKYIRAVLEPLLISHFGDDIIEDLFSRYAQNIARHISIEKAKIVVLILVLKLKE